MRKCGSIVEEEEGRQEDRRAGGTPGEFKRPVLSFCFTRHLLVTFLQLFDFLFISLSREREEEDRQVEAALRASMAMRRQAERAAVQERSTPKHSREERTDRTEPEEPKNNTAHNKTVNRPPGKIKGG